MSLPAGAQTLTLTPNPTEFNKLFSRSQSTKYQISLNAIHNAVELSYSQTDRKTAAKTIPLHAATSDAVKYT